MADIWNEWRFRQESEIVRKSDDTKSSFATLSSNTVTGRESSGMRCLNSKGLEPRVEKGWIRKLSSCMLGQLVFKPSNAVEVILRLSRPELSFSMITSVTEGNVHRRKNSQSIGAGDRMCMYWRVVWQNVSSGRQGRNTDGLQASESRKGRAIRNSTIVRDDSCCEEQDNGT